MIEHVAAADRRERTFFSSVIDAVHPKTLVEFGSWEGGSAKAWCDALDSRSLMGTVYCIDTWLGSPEMWSDALAGSEWGRDRLRIADGEPHVYEVFRSNLAAEISSGALVPVRATTECGTIFLQEKGIRADVVYVDADHSYRAVRADLGYAADLRNRGGLITGDDWFHRPIKAAVAAFCLRQRAKLLETEDGVSYAVALPDVKPSVTRSLTANGFRPTAPAQVLRGLSSEVLRTFAGR